MGIVSDRESLLSAVLQYAEEYYTQYKVGIPLRAISQHYAKIAQRLGLNLLDEIRADSRFAVDLSPSGAYRIAPIAKVSPSTVIMHTLKQNGGSVTPLVLKGHFAASGLSISKLIETLEYMRSIGAIDVTEERVTLLLDPDRYL